MGLLDSAPNDEKRKELIRWVGILILLNRQTTLKFHAQYTLLAQLYFRSLKGEICHVMMDEKLQHLYENILQYLPKEILISEQDYRVMAVGCAGKQTVELLEEYYFKQTGERMGKNDEVSLRILNEGI